MLWAIKFENTPMFYVEAGSLDEAEMKAKMVLGIAVTRVDKMSVAIADAA